VQLDDRIKKIATGINVADAVGAYMSSVAPPPPEEVGGDGPNESNFSRGSTGSDRAIDELEPSPCAPRAPCSARRLDLAQKPKPP